MTVDCMEYTEAELAAVDTYIASSGWWATQKVDGRRLAITMDAGGIRGMWCKGRPAAEDVRHHAIREDLQRLLPRFTGTTVLDGELMNDRTWLLFDIIMLNGEPCTSLTYAERAPLLEAVGRIARKAGCERVRVLPIAREAEEKRALWDWVCSQNGEGIVFKPLERWESELNQRLIAGTR